jgi:hypothetical protein
MKIVLDVGCQCLIFKLKFCMMSVQLSFTSLFITDNAVHSSITVLILIFAQETKEL